MVDDPHIPPEIRRRLLVPLGVCKTNRTTGGLSGARVWRCQSDIHGNLCLRQWPNQHPTPERLLCIHQLLDKAKNSGLAFIPSVLRDANGNSFWLIDEQLWELTQWLPGSANYLQQPNAKKRTAALAALAETHAAWSDIGLTMSARPQGVCERLTMLAEYLQRLEALNSHRFHPHEPLVHELAVGTVESLKRYGSDLMNALERLTTHRFHTQWVIRDIWSDHLLYCDDRLTGIVDFGAVRIDDPTLDLARMLGSIEPFDPSVRHQAVEQYNFLRQELGSVGTIPWPRVQTIDHSSTLLTCLQWWKWIVIEQRTFDVPKEHLLGRWQTALARLQFAKSNFDCN